MRQLGPSLPDGWKGVDIGPGTAAEFSDVILEARTVFWNGPMGVFEDPRFEAGTRTVAEAVVDCQGLHRRRRRRLARRPLAQFGIADGVDHVSTGGGASLELLEHGDLPGLDALRGAPNAGLSVRATAAGWDMSRRAFLRGRRRRGCRRLGARALDAGPGRGAPAGTAGRRRGAGRHHARVDRRRRVDRPVGLRPPRRRARLADRRPNRARRGRSPAGRTAVSHWRPSATSPTSTSSTARAPAGSSSSTASARRSRAPTGPRRR